jgi:hypothetical protein
MQRVNKKDNLTLYDQPKLSSNQLQSNLTLPTSSRKALVTIIPSNNEMRDSSEKKGNSLIPNKVQNLASRCSTPADAMFHPSTESLPPPPKLFIPPTPKVTGRRPRTEEEKGREVRSRTSNNTPLTSPFPGFFPVPSAPSPTSQRSSSSTSANNSPSPRSFSATSLNPSPFPIPRPEPHLPPVEEERSVSRMELD